MQERFKPDASPRLETQVARWASLVVKLGALAFAVELPRTFSINLQLLGGIWILQVFPAIVFGLFTRWFHRWALLAGWLAGMVFAASQLMSGELGELELVFDETLRKYPPAWIGPRRSVEPFEFAGCTVPGRAFVNYSSWASHHLPEVFPEPEEFRPERFTPEARAALPKGAYVPFGGGSRTCIGMRFGQLEIRTIATLLLARFTLSLPADFALEIRQMPTISPKNGLGMIVHPRPSRETQSRRSSMPSVHRG